MSFKLDSAMQIKFIYFKTNWFINIFLAPVSGGEIVEAQVCAEYQS